MLKRWIAIHFNTLGQFYLQDGRSLTKAEKAFLRATKLDPTLGDAWYNLGLIAKFRRRWHDSLTWNQEAAELNPANQPAWWNMGIAATALGDWQSARAAWKGFGIEMPPGVGEITMELGPTPIRLTSDGAGEVVWCRRIDPARAIIRSVPLPESGFHFGDVLLHDGAPSGHRILNGQAISVFDMIERLRPSNYVNFEIEVEGDAVALNRLFELAAQEDLGLEDWGTIRCLCRSCSQGTPHNGLDEPDDFMPPAQASHPVRLMAAAPSADRLEALLAQWSNSSPDRKVHLVRHADEQS